MFANKQLHPNQAGGIVQNARLKPGIFSNHSGMTTKYHQDQHPRSKSPYPNENQYQNEYNANNSFEANGRIPTHQSNENEPFGSAIEPIYPEYEVDQIRYSENQPKLYKPLAERTNTLQRRDSRGRGSSQNRASSSEKQLRKSIGPSTSISHPESTNSLKKNGSYSNIKNSSSAQKYNPRQNVGRNNVPVAQTYMENNENIDINVYPGLGHSQSASIQTRSTEKKRSTVGENSYPGQQMQRELYHPVNPVKENPQSHFYQPAHQYQNQSQIQLQTTLAEVERLRRENNNLNLALQNMNSELVEEKERASHFENEMAALNNGISEERSKYQTELVKISQQIKKLRNIQTLYVNEKKHSEELETQFNMKQKSLEDITGHMHEQLTSIVSVLEILLIRGDTYLEKQVQNQEFSFENYMKMLFDVRKVLVGALDASEGYVTSQDWRTAESRQVISSTKDLMKLRKNSNFKLYVDKNSYNSNDRKSTLPSTQYNSKSLASSRSLANLNNVASCQSQQTCTFSMTPTQFNTASPSDFGTKRDSKDVQINLYQSNTAVSQAQTAEFVPFNSRIHLLENLTNPQKEEFEFENIKEDIENEALEDNNDSFRKKDISPSKFSEPNGIHSLGSTILPRNNCSEFNETFENLISDKGHEGFASTQSKNYENQAQTNSNGSISSNPTKYQDPSEKAKFGRKKIDFDPKNLHDHHPEIFTQGITEYSNESHSQSSLHYDTKTIPREELTNREEIVPHSDRPIPQLKLSEQKQKMYQDPILENYFSEGPNSRNSLKVQDTQQNAMKRLNTGESIPTNRSSPQNPTSRRRSFFKEGDSVIELNCVDSNQHRKDDNDEKSETLSDITMNQFAYAKFEYNAQKENDLNFKKGDKIQVLKKTDSGWWIGLCNTKIGYFPFNYVTLAE